MGAGKQPTYGLKPEQKSTVKILFLTASLLSFIHSLLFVISLSLPFPRLNGNRGHP